MSNSQNLDEFQEALNGVNLALQKLIGEPDPELDAILVLARDALCKKLGID